MSNIEKKLSVPEFERFKQSMKTFLILNGWSEGILDHVRSLEERTDEISASFNLKSGVLQNTFAAPDENNGNMEMEAVLAIDDFGLTAQMLVDFMTDFHEFDNNAMAIINVLDSDQNPEKASEQLNQFERLCEALNQKHLTVKERLEQTDEKMKKVEAMLLQTVN